MKDESDTVQRQARFKEESKIARIQKSQHFTSVKAIEFDWIFNHDQGSAFIKTLTISRNVDMFSIPLIQNCIQFLWSRFRAGIILYLFLIVGIGSGNRTHAITFNALRPHIMPAQKHQLYQLSYPDNCRLHS